MYTVIGKQEVLHQATLALRNASDEWIRERMTVVGLRTMHELRGIEAIFQPGYKYNRAGVLLTNLAPAASLTMQLWAMKGLKVS